jgi:hypothetical protein
MNNRLLLVVALALSIVTLLEALHTRALVRQINRYAEECEDRADAQ